jgi:hypothetical protein
MVPEVNMNKLRIASAIAALTSALALPAWGADTTDATNNNPANLDKQVPSTATPQSGAATSDSATGGQQGSKDQANGDKHPPTAVMDSVTPAGKTTTPKSAAEKHPPTSQMDRAAPDQKSPGSTTSDTSPASAGDTSTRPN